LHQLKSSWPGEGFECLEVCGSQDQSPGPSDGPPRAPHDGAGQCGYRDGGFPHGIDFLLGSDFRADTIGRSVHLPLENELLAVEAQ
jgi:hypothetical protein